MLLANSLQEVLITVREFTLVPLSRGTSRGFLAQNLQVLIDLRLQYTHRNIRGHISTKCDPAQSAPVTWSSRQGGSLHLISEQDQAEIDNILGQKLSTGHHTVADLVQLGVAHGVHSIGQEAT